MSYERLPYDDAATTTQMASDCAQVGQSLHLPGQRGGQPVHDLQGGDYATPDVSDDLAELAAGMELHFD